MRRAVPLFIALATLAVACGEGQGAEITTVRSAIRRVDLATMAFTYTESHDGHEVVVTGRLEDDLRYEGRLSLDGVDVYEQRVSDDAIAIRLLDPKRFPQPIEAVRSSDPVAAEALADERWVVDHAGAPQTIQAVSDAGQPQVGRNPMQDAFAVFPYVERAIRRGGGMTRFNPESISYNPHDDPWSEDAERNLEDQGIRRYDLFGQRLPGRSERGTAAALPTVEHFRKIAVYVRGEQVVRIAEQISVADRPEFRRAEEGRAARHFLELRDGALAGFTQEPVRERMMTFEITEVGGDPTIELPLDAVAGDLSTALGPTGIERIFAAGIVEAAGGAAARGNQARFALFRALTAAKRIAGGDADYAAVNVESLKDDEPDLEFVADEESLAPGIVSVAVDGRTFRAAAVDQSGVCHSLVATAPAPDEQPRPTLFTSGRVDVCRASAFADDVYEEFAW